MVVVGTAVAAASSLLSNCKGADEQIMSAPGNVGSMEILTSACSA